MASFQEVRFTVANPSPYPRDDYVQIDLNALGVPQRFGAPDDPKKVPLTLSLVPGGEEIPYQIDYLLGEKGDIRILTFFVKDIPAGNADYGSASAEFLLKEGKLQMSNAIPEKRMDYYYLHPAGNEPRDGHNVIWDPARAVRGVKLKNSAIEVAIKLMRDEGAGQAFSNSGSATSVTLKKTPIGEIEALSPFLFGDHPEKRWGQLDQVVFFPLPWEFNWFSRFYLSDKDYKLVWSKSGIMRQVVTLKSPAITIRYDGEPFANPVAINCNLYRVIYVYTYETDEEPCYFEKLFVLTEKGGKSLSFRAYYLSDIYPFSYNPETYMFSHIPDYFAIWKNWDVFHLGYGFASDAHVRGIELHGTNIRWRLPTTHHKRTVHYFMYSAESSRDPFNIVGHSAWYEKVFKPLAPFKEQYRFPPPIPSRTDSIDDI